MLAVKSDERSTKILNFLKNYGVLLGILVLTLAMKYARLENLSPSFYYFGFFILSLLLIKKIEYSLLLIPFILFLMVQAPKEIGAAEIYFSFLFLISLLCYSWWWQCKKILLGKRKIIFFSILAIFILKNFHIAFSNSVEIYDWLRGILPFTTCLLYLPLSAKFSTNEKLTRKFFYAMGIIFFLYSAQVIIYYFMHKLYKSHWYFFENGAWIHIDKEAIDQYPKNLVFFFKQRITAILSESTNPFVPLGFIVGQVLYYFNNKNKVYYFGLALVVVSIIAAVMTITRSMLLCMCIVSGLLFLATCFLKNKELIKRGIFLFLFTTAITVSTIFALDLQDVYLNRFVQLIYHMNQKESIATDTNADTNINAETKGSLGLCQNKDMATDANINARIVEYKEAIKIFSTSPIFGAGFGIKHKILLDVGFGKMEMHEVGYIHNWVLYILMCGGIVGFLLYSFILCYPLVWTLKNPKNIVNILLATSLLFLIIYGCTFAVFRLINFNFLLAIFWAIVYKKNQSKDTSVCVE
jgi:hypothetical protein